MNKDLAGLLVTNFGREYSEILGINLKRGGDVEIFKWFLASVLFGVPIAETLAIKTYRCFESRGVLTPGKILGVGWEGLVNILDEGSYTRYDFKTSDKLLLVMENLTKLYGGSLNLLYQQSMDASDLESRIRALGKGIGEVTVSIFLRELRSIWEKAHPKPTPLVILAAKNLGIVEGDHPQKALKELEEFWQKNKVTGKNFVNLETALLRLGKDFCRKGKCTRCLIRGYCQVTSALT